MGEFLTVLCLFSGELLGDATFFFLSYRRGAKEGDNREAKRRQYYITLYSPLIALLACIPGSIIKITYCLLQKTFTGLEEIWSGLPNVIGVVDRLACIAVFMWFYRRIRKSWEEKFHQELIEPWGENGDPKGIYVRNELSGKYELSKKWVYVKDCVRYLMIINLLLLAVLHMLPKVREMSGSVISFNILELIPIVASTILMEFYNYLAFDDNTFFGFGKKNGKKESVFDLIRLKTEYEGKNIPGLSTPLSIKRHDIRIEEAMREYIGKLDQDAEPEIKLFVNYLEKRRWSARRHYHTGSLETAIRLIRGENLFCASPFYKDIDICIFFPAYLTVMKGKKVLVLAEDCDNLDELTQWLKQGIEEVQKLDDYYQVNILEETKEDADLGVLAFQDIYRPEDFGWLKKFFNEVGFVVVIEASGMLAGGQEAISNLAEHIGSPAGECIWLLCDYNAESMLDLFSHLLNKSFTYVSATPLPAEESLVGYWNVEQELQQPWAPVKHYIGAELQAAEVAWCNEVEDVTLYGEEMVPIYDLKWIAGQYYQQLHKRTGRKPHQYVMDDGISVEISGSGCKMREKCFLIVEDCNYNLYEASRQYMTRASEKAVVHILSPNYLLRNFMKGNEPTMNADPKYVAQFVPEYVNTGRNVAVHLIRRMLLRPVTETEICEELDKSEDWKKPFRGLEDVKELVRLIVPLEYFSEGDFVVSYQSRWDKDKGTNIQEKCYRLNSGKIKQQFIRYFQKACYIAEDGKKRHISKLILAGHLDQKYLKGQLAVFNGLYYEIIKRQVKEYEYILHVRRASEQISGRRYYRQDRCYELSNVREFRHTSADCKGQNLSVGVFTADIRVQTSGYYACKGWNEIADAEYIPLEREDAQIRQYVSKQFLKVTVFLEDPEEAKIAAVQMACLFQESFCTFYPQQYHLLSIAMERKQYMAEGEKVLKGVLADIKLDKKDEGKDAKEDEENDEKNDEKNEGACFYIIEDSMEDMGLLRSIERNFKRMQILLSEYMRWNMKSEDKYLLFGEVTGKGNGSGRQGMQDKRKEE